MATVAIWFVWLTAIMAVALLTVAVVRVWQHRYAPACLVGGGAVFAFSLAIYALAMREVLLPEASRSAFAGFSSLGYGVFVVIFAVAAALELAGLILWSEPLLRSRKAVRHQRKGAKPKPDPVADSPAKTPAMDTRLTSLFGVRL